MVDLRATPDAVREFLDARQNLLRAIKFDHGRGVSANDVARMAGPAMSRPVILRVLAVEQTITHARDALREHGLAGYIDVGPGGGRGWGATHAYVVNATDFDEFPERKATLFADLPAASGSTSIPPSSRS